MFAFEELGGDENKNNYISIIYVFILYIYIYLKEVFLVKD